MPEPKEAAPLATVDVEDVDEVIGLAAQAASSAPERLTVKELVDVGEQIGIPAAAVERAVTELEARRRVEAEARAQKTKRVRTAAAVGAGVLVVLVALGLVGQSGLQSKLTVVEQKRAQVRNVLDRKAEVEARLRGAPPSPDSDAERAGSENRVAIERRRYDEAAAEYNAASGSFPGSVWRRLFGLPDRAPLSNEVTSW